MERIPRPSRIVAFWQTLIGVHPSPVLIAIGKILLGILAIPVLLPLAILATLIWFFYFLGNRITKSVIALIEMRHVE